MNGYTDKCFECKHFKYVDNVDFAENPEKYGRFRDGLCFKNFPKSYKMGSKPPYIIWSAKAACFQFEPKEVNDEKLALPGNGE